MVGENVVFTPKTGGLSMDFQENNIIGFRIKLYPGCIVTGSIKKGKME